MDEGRDFTDAELSALAEREGFTPSDPRYLHRLAVLEKVAQLTREAYDYMEAFIKEAGEDVRHPADLVLCASRLHSAVGLLAGMPEKQS